MSDEHLKAASKVLAEQLKQTKTPNTPGYGFVYTTTSIPDIQLSTPSSWMTPSFVTDPQTSEKLLEQEKIIEKLRAEADELLRSLQEKKLDAEASERALKQYQAKEKEINEAGRYRVLVHRIRTDAPLVDFEDVFFGKDLQNAFVMSVDIRGSTDLMLKARTPEAFASFLTNLCDDFQTIVKDCYGVFDKFTGDGILAFFPESFTGKDAGYFTVSAADRCHKAFAKHYNENRTSFKTVPLEAGLGIGIDYGPVRIIQVAYGLTVVGEPVVYACRMGGAPPEKTFLNQRAYEQVNARIAAYCSIQETDIPIKHESRMLCYDITLREHNYKPEPPAWVTKDSQQATPDIAQEPKEQVQSSKPSVDGDKDKQVGVVEKG